MPNNEREFNLEKLKVDPRMWMRLAMPSKNGDSLESVFKDKDNPFDKNSKAAMETVQRLASEGKLYVREFGRSRHFHKVEMDGDSLKLGKQHEMKISNRNTDPVLGALMWMSRGYFKWLGFNGISNWFDKRVQRRAEIKELDKRYKEEYQSLTKDQKKQLKALRKHEKNLKKLEKLQKEADKSQSELDKLLGNESKSKGEMDSPLSQPPIIESNENTMQPTLMGDQPVQENISTQHTRGQFVVQQQTVQHEIKGEEEADTKKQNTNNHIIIEGEELTAENINKFPPKVVEAFKIIQQLIIEKEAKEQGKQEPVQEQPADPMKTEHLDQIVDTMPPAINESKPQETPVVTEEAKPEVKAQQEQNVQVEETTINQDAVQQNSAADVNPVQNNTLPEREQTVPNTDTQTTVNEEAVKADMPAPLNDPPKLEEEKVHIQERPKEQEQPTLQERLAAEKQGMDAVNNWKDLVSNSLFAHEAGGEAKEYYQMINRGNEAAGAEFLSGVVFGILSNKTGSPEQKQQVLDALLSGKALGNEHEELISNGVAAYNDAFSRKTSGNPERLSGMLADAMRELSDQAGRETTLSPRLAMLGRLLSNAAQMAKENDLALPLDEDEFELAQGAATLAEVSVKYHQARQFLGKEPMDITSRDGRHAVCDLLMGNAVEKMIQQENNNTQQIMGEGLWNLKNLRFFTGNTATRRGIQSEDIQALLEKPNSTKAFGIGKNTVNEIVQASMEVYDDVEKAAQKEMELTNQQEQPQINPLTMPV